MTTIPSSHIEAQVSQPTTERTASTRPFLLSKRSLSDLDYTSYGESEATPTPKPRKTVRVYSRASFGSGSRSPTSDDPLSFEDRSTEDSDSEDESDEFYDQFDLGDFTKEEIKIYESMVTAGETIRGAAPPEKSVAEMLEDSCEKHGTGWGIWLTTYVDQTGLISSGQPINRPAPVRQLPEELHELVRAGISNAIDRAISDNKIGESDRGSREYLNAEDPIVEYLETVFMEEISGPSPQISHFIRDHEFPRSWPFGRWLKTAAQRSSLSRQKQYEQDIYNFSRTLGHSMDDAERWVLKAREFWCEVDYGSTNAEEGEQVSSSHEMLDQTSREPSAGDSTFRSKDKVEDNLHIMTINELKGPGQLQHPEFPYFKFYRRSENDKATPATLKASTLTTEPLASRTDTGVEEEEKAGKKARKALKQEKRKAMRQAEKRKRKKGEDEQIANLGEPAEAIKTVEEVSQFEQLEDKVKSQRQKKEGRKRKEELEVPPQSEVYYEEQHKHKKRRVESDAQDVNFRKSKAKKHGPQSSPFFQRSSLTEAGKNVNRKVNQLMDHEGGGSNFKKKDVADDEAKMLVDFSTPMI